MTIELDYAEVCEAALGLQCLRARVHAAEALLLNEFLDGLFSVALRS